MVTPAALLGSGVVARLKDDIQEYEAGLVFVDYALSPVQQRNLEEVGIKRSLTARDSFSRFSASRPHQRRQAAG